MSARFTPDSIMLFNILHNTRTSSSHEKQYLYIDIEASNTFQLSQYETLNTNTRKDKH